MHFSSEFHLMQSRSRTKKSHHDQNILRNVGNGWRSCIEKSQEPSFFASCNFRCKQGLTSWERGDVVGCTSEQALPPCNLYPSSAFSQLSDVESSLVGGVIRNILDVLSSTPPFHRTERVNHGSGEAAGRISGS